MPRTYPSLEERFWSKVDRSGGPDACWPWLAGKDSKGYGAFRQGKKMRRAHVVSFELANGPLPEGQCGLHSCDNPPCVNDRHVFPGTKTENNADRDRKGRNAKGEKAHKAKLTARDVIAIRRLLVRAHWRGIYSQTARLFDIDESTIHNIEDRISWKHVP